MSLSVLMIRGVKVACGSRALVTADKGNGPLCVRSFAGVGAGSGRPPAGPAPMQREVAGEMDIEDIDVFIGTGRRQDGPLGHDPEPGRAGGSSTRALPNDEERLRSLYGKLADHGNLLVV